MSPAPAFTVRTYWGGQGGQAFMLQWGPDGGNAERRRQIAKYRPLGTYPEYGKPRFVHEWLAYPAHDGGALLPAEPPQITILATLAVDILEAFRSGSVRDETVQGLALALKARTQ